MTASTIILRLHKPQPRTSLLAVARYLGEQLPGLRAVRRRSPSRETAIPMICSSVNGLRFIRPPPPGLRTLLIPGGVSGAQVIGDGAYRHGLADRVRPAGSAAQNGSADRRGGMSCRGRGVVLAAAADCRLHARCALLAACRKNLTLAGLLVGPVLLYLGYAYA